LPLRGWRGDGVSMLTYQDIVKRTYNFFDKISPPPKSGQQKTARRRFGTIGKTGQEDEMKRATEAMDENYFMEANDEMIEYLTEKLETDFIKKEASYEKVREGADKLLNLLVTGIGGSALLLIGATDAPTVVGLAELLIGWFLCALYLLKNCITARERPSMFSPPDVLYFDDPNTGRKIALHDLKRLRVFDINLYLKELIEIIRKRACCLDYSRYGAAIIPIVGFVLYLLFWSFWNC
jgi:hypothetical protein